MEKWFHWIECNIAIALLLRKTVLYLLAWSRWSNYLSLTSAALCKLSALHPVGGETPCPVSQTMSHLLLWIKLCHVSIGQHHMNTGCNKIVKDPRKISWYRYSVWRCCRNIIALIINASQRPAAPLHSTPGIGVMNADGESGSCWKLVLPLHVMSQDHQMYNLPQVEFWHVRCKSKIAVYAWKKRVE